MAVFMTGLFVAGILGGTIMGSLNAGKQQCAIYAQAQQVNKQTAAYAAKMEKDFSSEQAIQNIDANKITSEVIKLSDEISKLNKIKGTFHKSFLMLQIIMVFSIVMIGALLIMKKWKLI